MLFRETLAAGINFDGTAGKGLIDFPTLMPVSGNDNERVQVLTFALGIGQASNNARLRDVYVVFAANLDDATNKGAGWIFHATSDVHEFVSARPVVLLPNWSGFIFAAEASGTFIKTFDCDYVRTNLATTVRGESVGKC